MDLLSYFKDRSIIPVDLGQTVRVGFIRILLTKLPKLTDMFWRNSYFMGHILQ